MDISPEYLAELPKLAEKKKAENTKYFQKLKRKKPRHLDTTVADIHEEVFECTDCLQCANCCTTTGPLFTPRDVERIAKHLRMKPAAFTEQYLRTDEDNDQVLQQVPCTFLGADNYCSIYDVRPKACREYPHTDARDFHRHGKLTVKNTSICPAAYEIVEQLKQAMPM